MTILKRLSAIYSEHRVLYSVGLTLALVAPLLELLLPHLAFLMLFLCFCGVCCVIYGVLLHFERSQKRAVSVFAMLCRRAALTLIAVFIVSFIFVEASILSGIYTAEDERDCILVLGCGLRGDTLTRMGAARADAAIEYMNEHPDCVAILCGGQGAGETVSEAQAMYSYMSARGIESSRLLKEERSTDTTQNIGFARAVAEQNGLDAERDSFAVVTNDFHLYRSALIARKAGFCDVAPINAPTPEVPLLRACMFLREYFSIMLEYMNI